MKTATMKPLAYLLIITMLIGLITSAITLIKAQEPSEANEAKSYSDIKQSRELLKLYREVIKRAIQNIPQIPSRIELEIRKVINLSDSDIESMSIEIITRYINISVEIYQELLNLIKPPRNISITIEANKINEITTSVFRIIDALGIKEEIEPLVKDIKRVVEAKDLNEAIKILKKLEIRIGEIKGIKIAEKAREIAKIMLEEIHRARGVNESIKGIARAILNINKTIEILNKVKDILEESNASKHAIEAIDKAILNLRDVTSVLNRVATLVQVVKPESIEEVKNITNTQFIKEVERKMPKVISQVEKLSEMITEVEKIIEGVNATYILEFLAKAKNTYEDITKIIIPGIESAIRTNNYTKALELISIAEVQIEKCKRIIENIQELIKEKIKPIEKDELMEEINELVNEVKKLSNKIKSIYEEAISLNATESITYLDFAKEIVINASKLLNIAIEAIEVNNISYAKTIVNKVKELISKAENAIDMAVDIIEIIKHSIEELKEVVEELRNEIKEIEDEIKELINYTVSSELATILSEVNDLINISKSLITKAQELISTSDIAKAKEIINEIKDK
ncbi:MAG: hypothetical protein DRO15_00765, partial [Thermoprotei archaeon]